MNKFVVACPACNASYPSFEKYLEHVFADHKEQPALRMKGKVTKI